MRRSAYEICSFSGRTCWLSHWSCIHQQSTAPPPSPRNRRDLVPAGVSQCVDPAGQGLTEKVGCQKLTGQRTIEIKY
jgi:hypothetical protein